MKTQRRLPAGSGPHPAPSPCPQELRGRTQPRLATGHSWHRSSQLSCRFLPASFPPSPLRRPASPRTCTACARKPRLVSRGGASLLPRAPLCSSPRRLLSPSGCASQRLRHAWDAAREVFVIDPSSPRPGSERFRAGSRRAAVAHAVLSRSLAAACLRCRPSRLPFAVPLTLVAPLSRLCPHRVTAHTAAPPCAHPVGCTRPAPASGHLQSRMSRHSHRQEILSDPTSDPPPGFSQALLLHMCRFSVFSSFLKKPLKYNLLRETVVRGKHSVCTVPH